MASMYSSRSLALASPRARSAQTRIFTRFPSLMLNAHKPIPRGFGVDAFTRIGLGSRRPPGREFQLSQDHRPERTNTQRSRVPSPSRPSQANGPEWLASGGRRLRWLPGRIGRWAKGRRRLMNSLVAGSNPAGPHKRSAGYRGVHPFGCLLLALSHQRA